MPRAARAPARRLPRAVLTPVGRARERAPAGPCPERADQTRAQHDRRKRRSEQEQRREGRNRDHPRRDPGQRPRPDPDQRLEHDRQHRRLDPVEQPRHQRRLPERDVDEAQPHDREKPRQHEQQPRHQAPARAVQQPAQIDRQLMRLRPRQQHAEVERVQEPLLADPTLLLDQDAVHHRDLPGRTAEAQRRDPRPDPHRLGKRHALALRSRVSHSSGVPCPKPDRSRPSKSPRIPGLARDAGAVRPVLTRGVTDRC